MRLFEIILIVLNVLTLLYGFTRPSKTVWLGAAGVNLAVLLLHGALEGFRYQMVFSYAFVVLLVINAAAQMSGRFVRVRLPRAFRILGALAMLVLLGFSAFLAYALPVFTMPKPTGASPVGITYMQLVDDRRVEPFLQNTTQKRALMVKIYYPAVDDAAKPFARYLHGSPELIRMFTAANGLPDFLFSHFGLVKTNSKDDLLLSNAQPTYPIVLFSHGAGTSMEVETSQSEDLASHGYIVVTIDHTYVSAATVFPEHVVWSRDATTDFHAAEPAAPITQIMADDARFVIDELDAMNRGSLPSMFVGRLDVDRIGAIGHSVGGAVAYNLAMSELRVKAAINLDGIVFVTPNGQPMAPFLMLANDRYHVQALQSRTNLNWPPFAQLPPEDQQLNVSLYGSQAVYDKAYAEAQANINGLADLLKASGSLYTIDGSDHMKFTDIGLYIGVPSLRELIGIGGETDPARVLQITKSVTLTFFDQHLRGAANDLTPLLSEYPELHHVDL